ncbi:MAG: hypothetical protein ACE5DN_00740 [Flavobacteriales bacterium]
MKKQSYIYCLLMLLASAPLFGQEEDIDETRLFYRSDVSGGAFIHSNGVGAFYRRSKRITGFKKKFLSFELLNMKHPKEHKSYNPYIENTKGFAYGKLNSLFILRTAVGYQKTIYSKETKRGVEIGYLLTAGPELGFVKPVFLEIAYPNVASYIYLSTERYDPERHNQNNIYGRASALKGIEDLSLYPGLQLKFGWNFEYGAMDESIRALETGLTLDAFYKEVPIMAGFPVGDPDAKPKNHQFFISLYLAFQFGKKFF